MYIVYGMYKLIKLLKLISHKFGDLMINLYLSHYLSPQKNVVLCFSMLFHAFSRSLSYPFVISFRSLPCSSLSVRFLRQLPCCTWRGFGWKTRRCVSETSSGPSQKTETRKASLLAALDDLGKCRILDLSKGEVGSGFDNDTPKRLYTIIHIYNHIHYVI